MDSSPEITASLLDDNWYSPYEDYQTAQELNVSSDSFTVDPRIPNVVVYYVVSISPVGLRGIATYALPSGFICEC